MHTENSGMFCVLIRVRYAECDAQSVVFNPRYGDYVDLVATEFFRAAFGRYQAMLDQGADTQVVSLKTDWVAPAKVDDGLTCNLRFKAIGNTSCTLEVSFSNYFTGRAIAVSQIVYVTVTPNEHQKTRIPEFLREKLKAPPAATINLAGL